MPLPRARSVLVDATVVANGARFRGDAALEFTATFGERGGEEAYCASLARDAAGVLVIGEMVDDIAELELPVVLAALAGTNNALLDEAGALRAASAALRVDVAALRADVAVAAARIAVATLQRA